LRNSLLAAVLWASIGAGGVPAAEESRLAFDIVDKIGWRGSLAAEMPAKVEEVYGYDAATDTVTVSVRFDRKGLAPLPPMLALAARHGFPVQFDQGPEALGAVSPLGPLMGIRNTDRYTYRMRGLGRYVIERPRLGRAEASPALQKALVAEVDKIVAAGHLRPWLVLVNVPGSGADQRGDVYWDNSAEALYFLAEAAPLLPPETAQRLKSYMKRLRESYAPELLATMPYVEGAARECSPHDEKLLAQWQDKVLAQRTKGPVRVWNLYGLARYYESLNEQPSPEVWARCKQIAASQLAHRDWATLYWLRGHTPAFNAVHGVNQLFAGFVGYIRLARMAGDPQAEALGWGMLARVSALRFAMGKYTQFLHDSRQFNLHYRGPSRGHEGNVAPQHWVIKLQTDPACYLIPEDPAWWVKARAGNWIGDLVAWNWTRPLDNVRQVDRLDETGVDVWEWAGVDCSGSGQKREYAEAEYWYNRMTPHLLPFRDMTPELGRFLADYLKPESAAFCQRVAENLPHWHAAYAEAVLSSEIGFMPPCDAHGQFLARAWILHEKPQELERLIDVPWVPRGDYFFLHKLTVCLTAGGNP
jgi:hypothetical protein